MALARLKSVASVTIPDTALCNAAVDLLESSSPEFLCTHCLRTYIFGSLAVRGLGRSAVDEEAAFCGPVLHDLGLVPSYRRDNRFEVDGADAARQFCLKHQVPPERADLVCEAIALHTSITELRRGEANPMSDHVINTDGAAIRVEESGAGEPALIFLHYWGGSSRTLRGVIDRLGGKSRCIALDQRGCGASIGNGGKLDRP